MSDQYSNNTDPPSTAQSSGSLFDLVNATKGVVRNLSQLNNSLATSAVATATLSVASAVLGMTIRGTASPAPLTVVSVGTTSLLAIAANSARLGLIFHNPNPSGNNLWVTNLSTAVANQGILVLPGDRVAIPSNCGWTAVAGTGSSNNLVIVELV
jgi:hypothetical protein